MPFDVPILYLAYNRPDHTLKTVSFLRELNPKNLFVSYDGPNPDRTDDSIKTKQVREIVSNEDWEFEIVENCNKENKGCKIAVSEAITWFFSHVEEGIIIEDDVLPNLDFFLFAKAMLERFRDNEKIMHISGNCFLHDDVKIENTLYYSHIPHIWGWATWSRAWKKYTIDMEGFHGDMDFDQINSQQIKDYFKKCFQRTSDGNIVTWDYQWVYSIWKNKGLCITPNKNLVENIGFDEEATHTKGDPLNISALKSRELPEPYTYPIQLEANQNLDHLTFITHFNPVQPKRSIARRIMNRVKATLKG